MKTKRNSLNVWMLVTAVVILMGFLVVGSGFSKARADGGSCVIKVGDTCLLDVLRELKGVVEVVADPEPTFGSIGVSGDRFNSTETLNGNRHDYKGARFVQGTTTVFSMLMPFASTTLDVACAINIASSSETIWTLATTLDNNDNHSTTSELASILVIADGDALLQYHSSTTAPITGTSTSNFLVLSVKGGVSGADETAGTGGSGFIPLGGCSVDMNILN